MKRILMVLIGGILTLTVTAQTITITFNGTNANRNYQVLLDGTSYYSNSVTNPGSTNTNVKKEITLTNQQLGSHTIEVYRLRNNSGTYNNGTNTTTTGRALYSNNFQLRQGYDMSIVVNGNGGVAFSEKRVRNQGRRGGQTVTPMADVTFNTLLQTVRGRWSQSSKYTAVRDALYNTSNYFTSDQVRQLLVLITSEANRLSLAKVAYPRITDPTNFTQIYSSVFNSTASRNSMDVFIRNNPNNNNAGNWGNNNTNTNNNTYRTAMADYPFSQLVQTVNNQYSQSSKYSTIVGSLNNSANYFTTAQIRQLLSLINSESDRLALAKQSYLRVTDPASFTTLYDLFYSQSNRNDLNTYVIQNGGTGTTVQTNTRIPVSDALFSQLHQKAKNHIRPSSTLDDLREFFNNSSYNFTTAQIRQLLSLVSGSILSSEADMLEVAKLSWHRVTDPTYFTQIFDLFTSQSNRDALNAYIQARPY